MGTRIVAKDVDAEDTATEYLAPVRRGLEALHLTNKSPAKALKNYAPGKSNGTFIGTPPIISDDYLQFDALSAYIQTGVVETEQMTIFGVVRSSDTLATSGTRPMYWGTYMSLPQSGGSVTTYGIAAFSSAANTISAVAGRGTSTYDDVSGAINVAADLSGWTLVCQETGVGVGKETRITNYTTGATAITALATPRLVSAGKLRIGSGYSTYAGLGDIALWQCHNVLLTSEEIATVVADLRALASRHGIYV